MSAETSPPPATDLAGRAALITGASRGIGLAIARHLLDRGAAVTITARKADDLDAAGAELARLGPQDTQRSGGHADRGARPSRSDRVLARVANSGDPDARAATVAATVERFGSLDILVNNTGINPVFGPLMQADLDAVKKIFDVNVVSALGFVQQAHAAWMREHGGAVVNISSVGGLRSNGVIAAYGASKAAMIRLTEELAWELGPGIRVNAVAPAVVKTRFAEALYADGEETAARVYPMKRLGTPDDVAALVAFLVSDAASWITGETVRVDGGLLATGST